MKNLCRFIRENTPETPISARKAEIFKMDSSSSLRSGYSADSGLFPHPGLLPAHARRIFSKFRTGKALIARYALPLRGLTKMDGKKKPAEPDKNTILYFPTT
jgi:hypothetical protein